jgi:glutamate--cysteine ligase
MSGPSVPDQTPVTHRRQLIEYFETACKSPSQWRIGTEHEKFAYRMDDLRPLPYDNSPQSIRALLVGLQRFGWKPVLEQGNLIALSKEGCGITLEPSGQLELSGRPLENLYQTCEEFGEHLRQVKEIGHELKVNLIGVGFEPKWARAEMPWMPKERYAIMRRYMPQRGNHGLDMMLRTCAIQVNLDFSSEQDMVTKFRVGLALQPIAAALFANSPFLEGKPSGYLSYRNQIWLDTDPDRCGILPIMFEEGVGFERYVDYALAVPMYFIYRNGEYIDASGQSFRDFLAGKLPALPGEVPTLGDWSDHLTTIYTEVRMKRFLEMRGTDGGPWQRLCALPALWVGLLYDSVALDAAWQLVKDWTLEEIRHLHQTVPRLALKTPFRNRTVQAVAQEVLAISADGLHRRARHSKKSKDESNFLEVLQQIAESGRTPAEELLEAYETRWGRKINPLFYEYAY